MQLDGDMSEILAARPHCRHPELLQTAMHAFAGYLDRAGQMAAALDELIEIGDETTSKGAARLRHQLDSIEPSVTFIGQVKAGKTSLINAMVGWPDLLPADVNPWTSVITSIHMDPAEETVAAGARFGFFDRQEWDRLIERGGRIGELASRAGAEEEMEKVRAQIERMREKSKGRLGRRFEMLLGQVHDFGAFDESLVEHYVCLGDDFEDKSAPEDALRGRFADITKSADLYVDHAQAALPLCIRDTPGVNDTFLMREQITIGAIRDSRISVLVLSAHQALSSVDMALVRLISNIESRDVVVFVNRVDELSDPAAQIAEIRASIRETLQTHGTAADVTILFGSALWANHALQGTLAEMPADSRSALLNLAQDPETAGQLDADGLAAVWQMSGIPALYAAIAERIETGIGKESLDRLARSAGNLARGVTAVQRNVDAGNAMRMSPQDLAAELDRIEARAMATLEASFRAQLDAFATRLDRSHRSFLDRATTALIGHLERYGENTAWTYEPTGLRLLLKSGYQIFTARLQSEARKIFAATAGEVAGMYGRAFGLGEGFAIDPPAPPPTEPPVVIAQTIALDLGGTWWRNWWMRKRGYGAFAADFHQMISQETAPIVSALKETQARDIRESLVATLGEFLDEQREIALGLADRGGATARDLDSALGLSARTERLRAIESTVATLGQQAA